MSRVRVDPRPPLVTQPPERLMRCWVDDWTTADEQDQPVMDVHLTAWRRYRRARLAWLDEHDVPIRDRSTLIPFRPPVRRHQP